MMCGKCNKAGGWIFLLVGILFLLGDLGVLSFFGDTLRWWTAFFVVGGIMMLASGSCSSCQSCKEPSSMKSMKPMKKTK